MKNKKKLMRNYIIVVVMIFVVISGGFLVTILNQNYQKNKLKTSPLTKIVKKHTYSELNTILNQDNNNKFIYFSFTNNKEVYKLDTKIKKILEDNKLVDNFIYFDLSEKNNVVLIDEINNLLKLNENKITSLPSVIYYRNNVISDVVTSSSAPFHDGKLMQIIDVYELN